MILNDLFWPLRVYIPKLKKLAEVCIVRSWPSPVKLLGLYYCFQGKPLNSEYSFKGGKICLLIKYVLCLIMKIYFFSHITQTDMPVPDKILCQYFLSL